MNDQLIIANFLIPWIDIDSIGCEKHENSKTAPTGKNVGLKALQEFIEQHINDDCICLASSEISSNLTEQDQSMLLDQILRSADYGGKLLLGNARRVGHVIPIHEKIVWIDHFDYSSLMIVFRPLFDDILALDSLLSATVIQSMNLITSKKLLCFPFIPNVSSAATEENAEALKKIEMIKGVQSYCRKFL